MPVRRSRTRRRRLVTVAMAIVGAIGLLAVAGLPVYVFPATDDPAGVDAVVVLGPPEEARFVVARQVAARDGGIPIVVSAPATGVDSVPVLGICRETGVICRTPDPFTTLGETRFVHDLALQHGWHRIAVVTTTPHIARARLLFDRCSGVDVRMVSSGPSDDSLVWWAFQYVYQTAGFVKTLFTTC